MPHRASKTDFLTARNVVQQLRMLKDKSENSDVKVSGRNISVKEPHREYTVLSARTGY